MEFGLRPPAGLNFRGPRCEKNPVKKNPEFLRNYEFFLSAGFFLLLFGLYVEYVIKKKKT